MAALTLDAVADRVTSLLAARPFNYRRSIEPFTFEKQPTGAIDEVFRVRPIAGTSVGGMSFRDDRRDTLEIALAKQQSADGYAAQQWLTRAASSIVAAVTRDGAITSGDYDVPDGRTSRIDRADGATYAVLQMSLPVAYEAQL